MADHEIAYYSEFASSQHISASPLQPMPGAEASSNAALAVSDVANVYSQVVRAIKAVHGEDIDDNVPLVQAGLDSLGQSPSLYIL